MSTSLVEHVTSELKTNEKETKLTGVGNPQNNQTIQDLVLIYGNLFKNGRLHDSSKWEEAKKTQVSQVPLRSLRDV